MILLTDKKKYFAISKIGYIHSELNEYYTKEIYACQSDSKEYQDILSKFLKLLDNLYQIIEDMKRYNNNNNNNN